MNLRDWDDPEADAAIAMVNKYGRAARSLGMLYGTGLGNTWFSGTPAAVRAKPLADPTGRRGNHGLLSPVPARLRRSRKPAAGQLPRDQHVGKLAVGRLIEIYHCQMETDDPYHHRVRPPLRRAVSRRGNH